MTDLDLLAFAELRAANVCRCETAFNHKPGRFTPGSTDSFDDLEARARQDLADELADIVCYVDLLAARAGIDLGAAVRRKFNAVSERRGSDIKLP